MYSNEYLAFRSTVRSDLWKVRLDISDGMIDQILMEYDELKASPSAPDSKAEAEWILNLGGRFFLHSKGIRPCIWRVSRYDSLEINRYCRAVKMIVERHQGLQRRQAA